MILEEVKAWQTRPLDPVWPIVYVDALVVKVRDGAHVVNKAAHIVLGVDLDGVKHVLRPRSVRRALEPLVTLADRTGAVVLGLIHVNMSGSTDPLTMIMASRAFVAVARAVLFVMRDPDDETLRLLGQPKNNFGRDDLPTLTFRIEAAHVADTDEGPVLSCKVVWTGESLRSLREVIEDAAGDSETRSATA